MTRLCVIASLAALMLSGCASVPHPIPAMPIKAPAVRHEPAPVPAVVPVPILAPAAPAAPRGLKWVH